jgi:hypothetical protein
MAAFLVSAVGMEMMEAAVAGEMVEVVDMEVVMEEAAAAAVGNKDETITLDPR